jgi:hypothetical protein
VMLDQFRNNVDSGVHNPRAIHNLSSHGKISAPQIHNTPNSMLFDKFIDKIAVKLYGITSRSRSRREWFAIPAPGLGAVDPSKCLCE